MRKAIVLAAAAFTLGATVAAAQPKKDIGYERGLGLAGHAAARGRRQELRSRQVFGFRRAMARPRRGSLVLRR